MRVCSTPRDLAAIMLSGLLIISALLLPPIKGWAEEMAGGPAHRLADESGRFALVSMLRGTPLSPISPDIPRLLVRLGDMLPFDVAIQSAREQSCQHLLDASVTASEVAICNLTRQKLIFEIVRRPPGTRAAYSLGSAESIIVDIEESQELIGVITTNQLESWSRLEAGGKFTLEAREGKWIFAQLQ
ncbi:hypothetical protein NKH48_34340 [Mesorhizobium sp. M1233]|uniref:hypothetical protein n=1 Tax=Mesorhizobium sp. M1233 TaxID=2957072 RepID=UPI00333633B3